MGSTIYRVTGGSLAVVIVLLGCAVTVLLYFSGNAAVKIFYPDDNSYTDENNIIRRRMPTDDAYVDFMLRAWIIGIVLMLPGVTGVIAALFYVKCTLVIHTLFCVLSLFIGSVLFAGGSVATVSFHLAMTYLGSRSYANIFKDCQFIRDAVPIPYSYVDEDCVEGRKAMIMVIAILAVTFITWCFTLADVLFRAFTSHNIELSRAKNQSESEPSRRDHVTSNPANQSTNDPDVGSRGTGSRLRGQGPSGSQSNPTSGGGGADPQSPVAGPSSIYPDLEEIRLNSAPAAPVTDSKDTARSRGVGSFQPVSSKATSQSESKRWTDSEGGIKSTQQDSAVLQMDNPAFEGDGGHPEESVLKHLDASVNLDADVATRDITKL